MVMEKIKQSFKKHPYIWGTVSFVIWGVPQWLSSIWSMVSSKPLAEAIAGYLSTMNIPTFSISWITTPIALLLYFWILYEVRRQSKTNIEKSICVKRTWIHYNRLEKEHVIDFMFEIFNGSCTSITIGNPSGTIILHMNKVDETLTTIQHTPITIDSYSEGRFSLQIVLPEDLKQKFLVSIDEKKPVYFYLDDLHLNAQIKNEMGKVFRLPTWNAFTAYFSGDIKFDIIITARVNA